ncbi:hypothetical protein SDC9_130810 [bioreactor metagenome]|uniref:PGF-CTERM archaeal protein-sorting signal domain-containing protein n=1 Tax=bioreactor metagenome TaxID=1076179 RepID=A0A645D3K0_9ZZZZ
MLKNKSVLVSDLPSDDIYKFFNIWVGNGGYGSSDYIGNQTVCFKVEKDWIQNEKIEQSSITLNRYNDTEWNPLLTNLSGEDDKYLYFIARTPGFSPFAITGRVTKENVTEILPKPDTQDFEQNNGSMGSEVKTEPEKTENTVLDPKENINTPGFEIIYSVIGLLGVFLYKRK